jgi:hypothetical protein
MYAVVSWKLVLAQATCGRKGGPVAGEEAVSDDDCGAGFVYNKENAASLCASYACDAGGTDKSTCCIAQALRALSLHAAFDR